MWGAGTLVGSAIYARWRSAPPRALIGAGAALLGAGFAVMAAAPSLAVAMAGGVDRWRGQRGLGRGRAHDTSGACRAAMDGDDDEPERVRLPGYSWDWDHPRRCAFGARRLTRRVGGRERRGDRRGHPRLAAARRAARARAARASAVGAPERRDATLLADAHALACARSCAAPASTSARTRRGCSSRTALRPDCVEVHQERAFTKLGRGLRAGALCLTRNSSR